LTESEIEKMRTDAKEHAEEDKKRRDEVEKLNQADSMVYSTQKNLSEYGDKIGADKRAKIEAAAERLKQAHDAKNFAEIDSALEQLNQAWSEASQELYQAQQEADAGGGDGAPGEEGEGFKDVDYEVVDEDDEK